MKLLDRHIAVHVIWGSALALFVLLTLFLVTTFVDDLDAVGKGQYTMGRAFQHLALKAPRLAFELFPIGALIGSLLGLGILASNSELAVIRAAGVSSSRIALSVMKAAAVLMIVALLVGELVAPISERSAEALRATAMTDKVRKKTDEGFWMRDGRTFINVRQALPNDKMADIYIYEFDENRHLTVATRAERAHYEDDQWVLEDLKQTIFDPKRLKRKRIERTEWSSVVEPELVSVIAVTPESLSMIGLYRYLSYLEQNNLSTARYELALWSKFIAPLSTGVMIFLAIPLVMGQLNSVGLGQRLVVGILIGMMFYVFDEVAAQAGIVYGVAPFFSAIAPTLCFLAGGVWLMRRLS